MKALIHDDYSVCSEGSTSDGSQRVLLTVDPYAFQRLEPLERFELGGRFGRKIGARYEEKYAGHKGRRYTG